MESITWRDADRVWGRFEADFARDFAHGIRETRMERFTSKHEALAFLIGGVKDSRFKDAADCKPRYGASRPADYVNLRPSRSRSHGASLLHRA